jgi:hypothetical protein
MVTIPKKSYEEIRAFLLFVTGGGRLCDRVCLAAITKDLTQLTPRGDLKVVAEIS